MVRLSPVEQHLNRRLPQKLLDSLQETALGLSDRVKAPNFYKGQPMRIDDGLKRSTMLVNGAQRHYDQVWHDPSVQGKAQELTASHNANITWGKQTREPIAAELRRVDQSRDALPRTATPEYQSSSD